MEAITITLDGVEVSGYPGMTILDLARESGVDIPTLCHDPYLTPTGACRLCLVEDERFQSTACRLCYSDKTGNGNQYPLAAGNGAPENNYPAYACQPS